MAEVGLARFSAREVAKRVGYSIGTIHNVFGSYDRLVTAINTRSFVLWADHLQQRLAEGGSDRIKALVEGYFEFARDNPRLWTAIYDHHMGPNQHANWCVTRRSPSPSEPRWSPTSDASEVGDLEDDVAGQVDGLGEGRVRLGGAGREGDHLRIMTNGRASCPVGDGPRDGVGPVSGR